MNGYFERSAVLPPLKPLAFPGEDRAMLPVGIWEARLAWTIALGLPALVIAKVLL